ncbi:MAG: NAD-dependent DNA ligase LigA [Tissierellia bacterium]|nr:NAD-dependent DNA ligase LigA [Tissierellia bacterium]
MSKGERIKELVKICNYHSDLYYVKDKPEISDKEYDALYDELEKLENETNYILVNSPTQKVKGEILPFLTKVKHSEPMLSAEKSKDINDIIKFMRNQDCILSWKLDGLTLVLKYNNGRFQQAITRGGGDYGEDVSHTVRMFTNVPLTIDYKGYLELRGEGLVTFKDFERINLDLIAKGEGPYSSPRNLSAGSVRQLDANITKRRNLIFIAFAIVKCDKEIPYKNQQFEFLKEQGFEVVYHFAVNREIIKNYIEDFKNKVFSLPYLTDGLIIEYNDIAYGKAQGFTGHHAKNMFALKWENENYEAKFKGVELNTTRTGMVSITGLFDEVDIDGVKVSRASLHNYDIFEELELGINDVVTVYRANEVIPQIEDNLTRSNTYKIDMKCPSCGEPIVIKRPKEARFLFCDNVNCPSKLVNKFVHFCSKDAINIDGFSEAGIELFIEKGFLKTFDDIYNLEKYKNEIIKLEGWGIRSYNKLIEAINNSKTVEMHRFLYGLGISQIGKSASKAIAKAFNNDWFAFEDAFCREFDFTQLEDFGQVSNDSLYQWYNNGIEHKMWAKTTVILDFIKTEKKENISKLDLTGKVFCVTGEFQQFKPRKKLEELIESLGGKLTDSVSSKTSYLLTNDTTSGSKKNQDALKYNVKIMNENEFLDMIK